MNIASLLEQIADKGGVWDDFLTPEAVKQLRACFGNDAQQARIGRHENLFRRNHDTQ
ncbi:hypothetical protein AB6G04_07680 [Proteus mirabilis]|uniref:hypothetical protein n=1 Tax=Proteus mirabilis TaxID=584 RepID=UPI0034DD1E9C